MEFFKTVRDGKVMPLIELAHFCLCRIEAAELDGVKIDDNNVVDLIADNSDAPLFDIRCALVVAGLSPRFPRATSSASAYAGVISTRGMRAAESLSDPRD